MATRKFHYDRFFGDNISENIAKKLHARQRLQAGKSFGQQTDIDSAGTPYEETEGSLDLSQRMPWARMWTAIESYELSPTLDELKELAKDPSEMAKWDYSSNTKGVKIYAIGNKIFNDYEESSNNGSVVGTLLQNNEFMTPNAGIVNITSNSTGYMGAVVETVVTFKIFNYSDWENIFVPFFMVPGATVFVDFGWQTSQIYNPVELIEGVDTASGNVDGDFKFKSFREKLFGVEGATQGIIEGSNGDLVCIRGRVTKFNSAVADDGSFDCTINLVSENYALIDYDQTTGIDFPMIFRDKVASDLIGRIESDYGVSLLKNDSSTVVTSDKLKRILPMYVGPNQQVNFMGEEGPQFVIMSKKSIDMGIFYRPIDDVKVDEVKKNVKGLSTSNQTYITMKKFSQLLNGAIGLEYSSESEIQNNISYDFEFGEITFNSTLYARQVFQNKLSKQLAFMYPTEVKSRSLIDTGEVDENGNVKFEEKVEDLILKDTESMSKVKAIPVKDLWINFGLVLKSFEKHTGIKEALKEVLDTVNDDSMGIFNLKLIDRGDNILDVTDANYSTPPGSATDENSTNTNQSNDPLIDTDDVDDTFVFSVFSPNTIVNGMDLQMTMENNALANKIAIQGMSAGSMVYPLSAQLKKDLAVKDINISEDDNNLFYRHIPTQNQDMDAKFMENTLRHSKTKEEKEEESIEKQKALEIETKNIETLFNLTNSPWKGVQEKTQADDATKPKSAYKRKNKEKPKLDDPEQTGTFPENLYIGSINNYFNLKMLGESITTKFQDIIMPYTISLDIYGIHGLYPGNKFKVDYLPAKYREKTYFIIMKITHSLTPEGWKTNIEGQMRFSGDKELDNTIMYNPNIHVSKKKLWNMGYTTEQIDKIREDGVDFWTIVPFYASNTPNCLDDRAMNYAPVDKFKWDCAGVRNGDDLSCCLYCPDGREKEPKDGWTKNAAGNCKDEHGKEILNPYLSWDTAPAGYEWSPGTGWISSDTGEITQGGASANITTIPVKDDGVCKDWRAANYNYTKDYILMKDGEPCEDGDDGFPVCCEYLTPVQMWKKYKATTPDGNPWPWMELPNFKYAGYSGDLGRSKGSAGFHCKDYESDCKWCCAYGACGGGSSEECWDIECSQYLWPSKTGYVGLKQLIGHYNNTYSGKYGLQAAYHWEYRGMASDIFESVAWCPENAQDIIDWYSSGDGTIYGTIADTGSATRWLIAHYNACRSLYDGDPFQDKMNYNGGSSGGFTALLRKYYDTTWSGLCTGDCVTPETIADYMDSGTATSYTTDWCKCFLFSDFGDQNEYANTDFEETWYNFPGACMNTTANNENANRYSCADNTCCNY